MALHKTFKTDTTKEVEGVWVAFDEDVALKLARAGGQNFAYQKYFAKLIRPFKRQIDNNTLPQNRQLQLMAQAYAHNIVLDWKQRVEDVEAGTWSFREGHIQDEDGTWLSSTAANIEKVLMDLPDFFQFVRDAAMDLSLFMVEEEEENAKK